MIDKIRPRVDEYSSELATSPHFSPRFVLDLPILPSLTLTVADDGRTGLIQRWYDVSANTLEGVGVRSRDFLPDGSLSLVDKDGKEIRKVSVKLDVELDGLPLLLARIEKVWEFSTSFNLFWKDTCEIIFRTPVPTFKEVVPDVFHVTRMVWMEFACFWAAFLAKSRCEAGEQKWQDAPTGDRLLFSYVEFYNSRPERGPRINGLSFVLDRVRLSAQLAQVQKAATNQTKKETLETLAEIMLNGIDGFDVQPSITSATGELDRFVRNTSTYPQFSRLGPTLLVECKHWGKPAGTDEIGAFIADLQDAKLGSGILLSLKGVSREGQSRIFNYHQRGGGFIISLSEKDIENICNGKSLALMMLEKMEAITFQRRTSIRRPRK